MIIAKKELRGGMYGILTVVFRRMRVTDKMMSGVVIAVDMYGRLSREERKRMKFLREQ